ncbi:sigma 54-interacting transcriptional regulator [Enterococcus avium]|uniref:sigma 54-interacting transcriptional regulator n=1 Tax=Enterococcus avium TaxID=33945 RepID=UPI00232EE78F|nr:sigma 54-interacting transcriptional regulator [Enterococcus avium]MDB1751418.1 sigma 54-interacting transcriptional regulator [Enterococcus avium]MDB1755580.1 sigma 54-interacting transcriptional regulator [Enterococcus avium]MDB1762630.1 sigma 54-interacting transcriptional regulator [Enterococcus avium]
MTTLEEAIVALAEEKCTNLQIDQLQHAFFDTPEIEEVLQVSRTQASRAANRLVESGELIKVNTRPVLFLAKKTSEQYFNLELRKEYERVKDIIDSVKKIPSERIFEQMIGYDKSLSEALEQLKTAVFYPGNGLPIMIMGDTGVGKSYFVQIMHEYMIKAGILSSGAPYKILNCAQYYNNPELLSGLLFGYAKGAFTGAYESRVGLLEEADQGLLFLDEVHRLNAEGQEKLFTFMDKGTFSRIGETTLRKAKVRLAFATTEKPQEFLQTFLRRIPIHIYIPNMDERGIMEKRQMIEYLFSKESRNLNQVIEVTPRVMNILLQTHYEGNIGEVENTIKYACGSAIARNEQKQVKIQLRDLPQKIYAFNHEQKQWTTFEGSNLIFSSSNEKRQVSTKPKELIHFISRLKMLYQHYEAGDENLHELKKQWMQQVTQFMDELVYQDKYASHMTLEKFILTTMQEIFRELDYQTKFRYDGNFVLFFAHYIYRYVLKGETDQLILSNGFEQFVSDNYRLAKSAINKLLPEVEKRLDLSFNEVDRCLFILFLSTLEHAEQYTDLDAIILAHGYATASSIANVCNRMLGNATFASIDMPIEATLDDISEKVRLYIEENQVNRGLVLLIDMGSLNMIYEQLKQDIEIPILFIDQLGTLMALEIGNLIQQGKELTEIAEQMNEVMAPNVQLFQPQRSKRKAIITTCFTGIGTAVQIQRLLYDCLEGMVDIEIIPTEFRELKEEGISPALTSKYDLLAIIGTDDPEVLKGNFVYLETIISGDGSNKIAEIFQGILAEEDIAEINNRLVKNFSLIRVIESLTILDTKKIMELIEECIQQLEIRLSLKLSNARKVAMYVHVSCMVERLIRHSEILDFPDLEKFSYEHQNEIRVIQEVFSVLEQTYSVTVPLTEVGYIHNILYNT